MVASRQEPGRVFNYPGSGDRNIELLRQYNEGQSVRDLYNAYTAASGNEPETEIKPTKEAGEQKEKRREQAEINEVSKRLQQVGSVLQGVQARTSGYGQGFMRGVLSGSNPNAALLVLIILWAILIPVKIISGETLTRLQLLGYVLMGQAGLSSSGATTEQITAAEQSVGNVITGSGSGPAVKTGSTVSLMGNQTPPIAQATTARTTSQTDFTGGTTSYSSVGTSYADLLSRGSEV